MKTFIRPQTHLAAVCMGVLLAWAQSAQAIPSLDPMYAGTAPAAAGQGLAGSWYKADNDAHFSNYMYTETDTGSSRYGETAAIKSFSWATGIWAATDIAAMASSPSYVTATATSLGAVSYANNIYNNTVNSGGYGSPWAPDYARTLAPIIGGANACDAASQNTAACAGEQNYAAIFTGYIYVAAAGIYDFGVFADDGFLFNLLGANNSSLSMNHNALAGSSGRDLYSLGDENGSTDGISLDMGYYGIDLSYFNREEAGVIDLGWRGPGNVGWSVINDAVLYNAVPEPGSLGLMGLALMGMASLWHARRRSVASAAYAGLC